MKVLLKGNLRASLCACLLFACSSDAVANTDSLEAPERVPGVGLSTAISQVTGIAVSPMLGISCVGAWTYWNTEEHLRGRLPWFCSPYIWGFCFVILFLCATKDILGSVLPSVLKKPFDAAELLEDNASALLVGFGAVPSLVTGSLLAPQSGPDTSGAAAVQTNIVAASLLPLPSVGFELVLLVPLAVATFFVVWVTFNAINVLILLSPFGFIDLALKMFKVGMAGMVVIAYLLHPLLGAFVSFVIIVLACFLAGRAFRLSFFGLAVVFDLVFGRWRSRATDHRQPHVFLAARSRGVLKRTYGRLVRGHDGRLGFAYRPFFILPWKTIPIDHGCLVLQRGLVTPALLSVDLVRGHSNRLVLFMPRYAREETRIVHYFNIREVRASAMARGLSRIKQWYADVFGSGVAFPVASNLPRAGRS